MVLYTRSKIGSVVEFINERGVPPHSVIPDFVNWKEGDTIRLEVSFYGSRTVTYLGVTSDMKLAFKSLKKGRHFTLPPNFFVAHYKRNKSLDRRKRRIREARIKKEVRESPYSEFLEAFRKAYREQNGEEMVHRTHLGNGQVELEQEKRVKARA
jgi:hypothetical protein